MLGYNWHIDQVFLGEEFLAAPIHSVLAQTGPVRFSYNPYFSACFISRNSIFLSQQISWNSVSAFFSAKRTGPFLGTWNPLKITVTAHYLKT